MIKPKYSLELEQRVLENLMDIGDFNSSRVQTAMLQLSSNCFYKQENAFIFGLIKECFNKNQTFSFIDVLMLIDTKHTDAFQALQWIMNNYQEFHINNRKLEEDVQALLAYVTLRKQLSISHNMIREVEECLDPIVSQQLITNSLTEIANLNARKPKSGISNTDLCELYYDNKIPKIVKIPTDCKQLNQALDGGINPKSLIIVAGGASGGKTGFSIFLMDAIARTQPSTQCLFFSIEMECEEIWRRHIGICGTKKFDAMDDNERLSASARSMQVPVEIYDTHRNSDTANIDFIVSTTRLKNREQQVSVVVVDYLGLVEINGHYERNDLRQSAITTKLAQLAIELNCTVIALSQINRGAANRSTEDRCPWPHDAADSSGGHRSAALWLGIDRPELYQEDPTYRNQFVVKCRKNRFGSIFELILAFNDGTFAEVHPGMFKKPYAPSKNAEKSIFSPYCDDYVPGG